MGQKLTTFQSKPQDTQTVTLGAAQYRMRLTWRARTAAWYFDLYQLDGTPIILGVRLSPGWGPMLKLVPDGRPAGRFYVRGPEPYEREMLAPDGRLVLVHYSDSEIPAPSEADALTVTIP
jgi:hypothetical protein